MEKDDDWQGEGNEYTTEFRQLDVRLGRWMSPDPMMAVVPDHSPYEVNFNNPIVFTDPLGLLPTGGKKGPGKDRNGNRPGKKHRGDYKLPGSAKSRGGGGGGGQGLLNVAATIGDVLSVALAAIDKVEQVAGKVNATVDLATQATGGGGGGQYQPTVAGMSLDEYRKGLVEQDLFNRLVKNYLPADGDGIRDWGPDHDWNPDDTYSKIGGGVAELRKENPISYNNSCTLRICYTLNKSGIMEIPYDPAGDGDWMFAGADTDIEGGVGYYILRVKPMNELMNEVFSDRPKSEGTNISDFKGKKGIM